MSGGNSWTNVSSVETSLHLSPLYRLNIICKGILFQRKKPFIHRLHNYWLLKRQSRNGVPLVRHLLSSVHIQRTTEPVWVRNRSSLSSLTRGVFW